MNRQTIDFGRQYTIDCQEREGGFCIVEGFVVSAKNSRQVREHLAGVSERTVPDRGTLGACIP